MLRYPGGKLKLKKVILEKLNSFPKDWTQYREPFVGSCAIGINFPDSWINDRDYGIYSLWDTIIKSPKELKDLVRDFIPSVDKFYEFKSYFLDEKFDFFETINIGFKKLAIHQISYSGLGVKSGSPLGGKYQKSNYKIDCRWNPDYICKKIDKYHEKMKDFRCTCCNYLNLLEEAEKALIYLDPPYFVKGNDLYQIKFNKHEELANYLKKSNHYWLLSYDNCPEIRDLYSWAKIEEVSNTSTISTKSKKNELLIYAIT